MKNALTIDVEDWFCAHNISLIIGRNNWDKCEPRIERNMEFILDTLDKYKIKATFFVLGWIAERFPNIVKELDIRGHEIGTHSYSHTLITNQTPEEFREDIVKSIDVIRHITRSPILGFRAPSFTITKKTLWALDILAENNIKYDSSVFPIGFHPDYGVADAPLTPYKITEKIIEFPLTCVEILGKRVPISGGAYFRLLPYSIIQKGLKKINNQNNPFVFYIHPWEFDPDQPKVNLPFLRKMRHYYNLNKTKKRFIKLINEFEFAPMKEVLKID